jgi:hypothetical protein
MRQRFGWGIVGVLFLTAASPPVGARLGRYEGEFAYGLAIVPPWTEAGRLIVNFPEHLEYDSRGMGILRYSDPAPKGRWEVAADGTRASLRAESSSAPGVRVEGEAKALGSDRIEVTMRIINAGPIALPAIRPLYCFHYDGLAGFPKWVDNFKHTYLLKDGKPTAFAEIPTRNPAATGKAATVLGCEQHDNAFAERRGGLIEPDIDAALGAVESLDGKRKLIIAWSPGKSVLSNASIPCVHADPYYGTIEAGRSAEAKGVILFTEDPLKEVVTNLRKEGWGAPPTTGK